MPKLIICQGCDAEVLSEDPTPETEQDCVPRLCRRCRSDGELHGSRRRGGFTPCANCDLPLDIEDVLAGRRLCLACRSDRERFNRRWRRKFRRCGECGRILKRGFCSVCYWKHHRRSRRYEPMDPDLKKLKYQKRARPDAP